VGQLDILTSLRAALETTRGTGVNPTRILEQTDFSYDPDLTVVRPEERRGSYENNYVSTIDRETGAVTFSGLTSYQQAAWLGNIFFAPVTSGTGAGADKTYDFIPSGTADNVKSTTLEWSYDTPSAGQPGQRMVYAVGQSLELNFDRESNDGVNFSATMWSPKTVTDISAFGGTPTALTTNLLSNPSIFVYIDSTTIGTTLDQNVSGADFTLSVTWAPLNTFNQSVSAQDTFKTERDWSCVITRYAASNTEHAAWKAGTARKIRVKSTGPSLGGSNHSVQLDLYGVYTDYDEPSVGGVKFQQYTLSKQYDSGLGGSHKMIVVTDTTSIT